MPWLSRITARACVFGLLLVSAAASVGARSREQVRVTPDAIFETSSAPIRVVTVAGGLDHPWSLAFLPDGDILVSERAGRLRIVRRGALDPLPIRGLPEVHARLHGGLLDLALHPHFATNHLVYFTYTLAGPDGATVAVARGQFDGGALVGVENVFVADAWSAKDVQFGARLTFDGQGLLYLSIGDRDERHRAQNLTDHAGTIVRIRDDGSVPDDNPFVATPGARAEIFSYGHRNVQGLTIHPQTGAVWANEHGPQGGDEVNLVTAGRNYGWPLVTLGSEYTGDPIGDDACLFDTVSPQLFWTPSIGVSGLTFYNGRRLGAWTGSMFVGALAGRHLQRVLLADTRSYGREPLLGELRLRIRDVREGPDELLYVLTDENDGAVLKIEPVVPLTTEARDAL